jgi:hypothetical protein
MTTSPADLRRPAPRSLAVRGHSPSRDRSSAILTAETAS